MAEERGYKPEAKCKCYKFCSIYNASLLQVEFEAAMCGKGQQLDESYLPVVPEHPNIQPVRNFDIWPGGECPAFKGYIYQGFIGDLSDLLDDVDREIKGKPPKS